MRDKRFEGTRKLYGNHARGRPGKQRKDITLQSSVVGWRDWLVIRPRPRRFSTVRGCDTVFDPYGDGLASGTV